MARRFATATSASDRPAPKEVPAIVVDVREAWEDLILGVLGADSLAVQIEPGTDGWRTLRVFVPRVLDRDSVERALASLGIEPGSHRVQIESVPDCRWVERYQQALASFSLGVRFHVDPGGGGETEVLAGRIVLRLAPGRAFGTGEHSTTRLCVAMLEDLVRPGEAWLDLGCGTAILALVAAHCGARVVRAVDADPDAVEVAREVVTANGFGDRVEVARAITSDGVGKKWDGVVANLDERTLVESAAALAALVAPGGALVCSGFLEPDARGVVAVLEAVGLAGREIRTEAEWAAVAARRP